MSTEHEHPEATDSVEFGETDVSSGETDTLLSRLRLIEDQPLEQRATAFAQIYEKLQSTLEGGDSSGQRG